MCLAIPGKILEINLEKKTALVDFDGLRQEVIIALLQEPRVGNYVIVHAGYAIEQMNEEKAMEAIEQWKEIAKEQDLDISDII
ncbi:MAG: HypC/HybG/HupF family hydrogenase formation chaperone [Promethearchaeota archaeon]